MGKPRRGGWGLVPANTDTVFALHHLKRITLSSLQNVAFNAIRWTLQCIEFPRVARRMFVILKGWRLSCSNYMVSKFRFVWIYLYWNIWKKGYHVCPFPLISMFDWIWKWHQWMHEWKIYKTRRCISDWWRDIIFLGGHSYRRKWQTQYWWLRKYGWI